MDTTLQNKKCSACSGDLPVFKGDVLQEYAQKLPAGWEVKNEHHLERVISFPDFASALNFVNKVGEIAESEGHHPDIYLTYGKVKLDVCTHKVDGLTENDFIFATKAESALGG
jgi:4a-hydroxytetrahydrobiopterin dehydratase